MDESKLILGGSNWADRNNIDLRLNQRVSEVLPNENAIIIENNNGDNEKQSADFLVVATGAEPKIPPFKGADLAGVFTLRSMSDAKAIKEASQDKQVVIVGMDHNFQQVQHLSILCTGPISCRMPTCPSAKCFLVAERWTEQAAEDDRSAGS